jgi:hypothetical protein
MAIEIFLRGGLGNQLFQYGAGIYLARKQNEEAVFRSDLLPLEPDSLSNISRWPVQIRDFHMEGTVLSKANQPYESTNSFSKIMQAGRLLGDSFPKTMLNLGYLSGERIIPHDFSSLPRIRQINSYCNSAQPARLLEELLRNQITNLVNPSLKFKDTIEESKELKPIVVHLRLGDYRGLSNLYGRVNIEKLRKIIKSVRDASDAPTWLFTDSPEDAGPELIKALEVTKVIGPSSLSSPIENLLSVASGSNLICANSTFSWWAAFLKGPQGKVFYPEARSVPIRVFTGEMVMWDWTGYDAT